MAANRECAELRIEVMRLRNSPDSRTMSEWMSIMLSSSYEAAELKKENTRLELELEKLRAMAAQLSTAQLEPPTPRILKRLRAIAKLRCLT